jgi:formylmethanofuran dehydrogenase subunit E
MRSFEEYVALAGQAHGHICAGQILGLRMALHGLALLGIEDPVGEDRKRLVTFVEIDRCMTDAIGVVTGCRLGKRALKFRDFGKVAATFCDVQANRAVRLVAKESSKQRARELFPDIADRKEQQMRAYREIPASELFDVQWVRVSLGPEELPGYKAARAICESCGEAINYKKEVRREEKVLCKSCAGESYYQPL